MEGRLTVCPRCGTSVFSRKKSTIEMDGGFSHANEFEPLPDGWQYAPAFEMFLCPVCTQAYENLTKDFIPSTPYDADHLPREMTARRKR